MFFSHQILTRKGPLGQIWIAATLGPGRLSRRYASHAPIARLCTSITAPAAPFALRLSAQLLLGVARVFARKSDIVLADSAALLGAVARFGKEGRKKGRKGQKKKKGGIDLEDDDGGFEKITLPEKRKKRKAGGEMTTSLAVALQGDPSVINLPASAPWLELDDLAGVVEMAFPTLSQEAGGSGRGRASSGSSQKTSGGFRARAEDITISEGHNRLSDSDLMIGVGGLLGSGSEMFMDLPMPRGEEEEREEEEFQGAFAPQRARAKGGSSSASGRHRSFAAPDNMTPPVPAVQGYDEMVTPAPGGDGQFLPAPEREGHVTPTGGSGGGMFTPGANDGAPGSAQAMGSVPESSPATPHDGSGGRQDVGKAAAASAKKPPRAPRGGRRDRVRFDEVTELTATQMQQFRMDTSDVMTTVDEGGMPQWEVRKRRKTTLSRSADAEAALTSNTMLSSQAAPELNELWNDLVAHPKLAALARVSNMGNKRTSPASSAKGSQSKIPSPAGNSKDDSDASKGDPVGHKTGPSATPDLGMPSYESLFPVPDEGSMLPPPEPLPDFMPPHMTSVPPPQDMEVEKLRDAIVEEITEADRAAFDVARRLSFEGGGSAGNGSARAASLAASLQSRLSRESKVGSAPGSIGKDLFGSEGGASAGRNDDVAVPGANIPDSLFQLEEETEPQETMFTQVVGRPGDKSPMARIDIKTFKVLGLLREIDTNDEGKGSDEFITEFSELSADCSRGTKARMFYHVLALTTNDFIRVEQPEAYGEIDIHRGPFF